MEDKMRVPFIYFQQRHWHRTKNDLNELIEQSGEEILSYTYDGDTARAFAKRFGRLGIS